MKIKLTSDIENPRYTILIYGASGIGKTYLISTITDTDSVFIIDAENGLLSLKSTGKTFTYVNIEGKTGLEKLASLREIVKFLYTLQDVKYLVIDSLTEVVSIFVEALNEQFPDRKDSLVLWNEYTKMVKSFVKTIRDMNKFSIIMTALAKTDKDEYNRRYILPDINGKIAERLPQYFDEVFYYTTVKNEKKEHRVLHTHSSQTFVAKDRSGLLLPMVKPNLQEILDIFGGKNG